MALFKRHCLVHFFSVIWKSTDVCNPGIYNKHFHCCKISFWGLQFSDRSRCGQHHSKSLHKISYTLNADLIWFIMVNCGHICYKTLLYNLESTSNIFSNTMNQSYTTFLSKRKIDIITFIKQKADICYNKKETYIRFRMKTFLFVDKVLWYHLIFFQMFFNHQGILLSVI